MRWLLVSATMMSCSMPKQNPWGELNWHLPGPSWPNLQLKDKRLKRLMHNIKNFCFRCIKTAMQKNIHFPTPTTSLAKNILWHTLLYLMDNSSFSTKNLCQDYLVQHHKGCNYATFRNCAKCYRPTCFCKETLSPSITIQSTTQPNSNHFTSSPNNDHFKMATFYYACSFISPHHYGLWIWSIKMCLLRSYCRRKVRTDLTEVFVVVENIFLNLWKYTNTNTNKCVTFTCVGSDK